VLSITSLSPHRVPDFLGASQSRLRALSIMEEIDILETEIRSWARFGYALREDNRILFHQMLDKCRKSEYFECVDAKGEGFTAESLFLILVLEQQKMINKLLERLVDKVNTGKNVSKPLST
jgi:hypothetical protein